MPPLPSVEDVIQVKVLWSDDNDVGTTSNLFLQYSGAAPDAAELSNFCTVVCNSFAAQNDAWGTDTTLTGATAVDLSTPSSPEGNAVADVPGIDTGTPLSGGTAVVINYHIARRYRGGKPRNYFPWGTSSDLGSRQNWGPASVTKFQTAITDIMSDLLGSAVGGATISNHVNVSYYEGSRVVTSPTTGRARNVPIRRTEPVVDTIVARTVSVIPGSQRRRNRA